MPRSLEHVDRAFDVYTLIKRRISETWAYARPRGQMDHLVEFYAAKHFIKRCAVGQVALFEFERFGQ